MIGALLLVAAQVLGGPEPNTEEGARRFAEGDLDAALRAFSQALADHPGAPQNDLNIAGVHYRMAEGGDPESLAESVLGYRSAARTAEGTQRRDAWFNLGNALYRGGEFDGAAAAYAEAIVLDPEDLEARQNLELALRELHEMPQQQQGEAEEGEEGDEEQQAEAQQQQGEGEEDEEQPQPEAEEVPDFSPEQAERILAALAEIERQFQEQQREENRARAVRRGRH